MLNSVVRSAMQNRGMLYTLLIAFALFLFELFQFSSDRQALLDMMGVVKWANILAFALCAIDFAGLAKLGSGTIQENDGKVHLSLAWILSAFFENFLTWFVVSNSAAARAGNIMVSSGRISLNFWVITIPILFSLFTWGIQVAIVYNLEKSVDFANKNKRK